MRGQTADVWRSRGFSTKVTHLSLSLSGLSQGDSHDSLLTHCVTRVTHARGLRPWPTKILECTQIAAATQYPQGTSVCYIRATRPYAHTCRARDHPTSAGCECGVCVCATRGRALLGNAHSRVRARKAQILQVAGRPIWGAAGPPGRALACRGARGRGARGAPAPGPCARGALRRPDTERSALGGQPAAATADSDTQRSPNEEV